MRMCCSGIYCAAFLLWEGPEVCVPNETFCTPHCSVPHMLTTTFLLQHYCQPAHNLLLLPYGPANCSHGDPSVQWCWAAWRALLYFRMDKMIHFINAFSYVQGNFIVPLTVFHDFCVPDDNLLWSEGLNPTQFSYAGLMMHSQKHVT